MSPTEKTVLRGMSRQDRRLRARLERRTIEKLIERLESEGADLDALCRIVRAYCDLRRHDVAAEKNLVTLLTARPRSGRDADPAAPPEAADFRRKLARTVRDLYGIETEE
ncbi:MAG: hypothetical protein ACE5F9_02100 [Phycisphaerae bacterium]